MKKSFLLIALMLLCAGVNAQIVSSRSSSIKVNREPLSKITYLKAGLNFANFSGDVDDSDSKLAYDIMLGFQKPIGSKGIYWGMEGGLSSNGYKFSEKTDYASAETNFLAHNILLSPVNFGFKYMFADSWNVDVHAGAYASYDYAGQEKLTAENWRGEKSVVSKTKLKDLEYNKFDVGLNIGLGIWYKRCNLDFTIRKGLLNRYKNEDDDDYYYYDDDNKSDYSLHTSNFIVKLGIAF